MIRLGDRSYADIRVMARSKGLPKEMEQAVAVEVACRYINAIDDLRDELNHRNKLTRLELDALRYASDLIQKQLKLLATAVTP